MLAHAETAAAVVVGAEQVVVDQGATAAGRVRSARKCPTHTNRSKRARRLQQLVLRVSFAPSLALQRSPLRWEPAVEALVVVSEGESLQERSVPWAQGAVRVLVHAAAVQQAVSAAASLAQEASAFLLDRC